MPFIFAQNCIPAVPVWGEKDFYFPVNRIYCVGANYSDHVAELGKEGRERPFFFMKPSDALVICKEGKSVDISYARDTENLCLEIELVVGIGQDLPLEQKIQPEQAMDYVFGYAAGIEFTRRNWQLSLREGRQPWERAKSFDASVLITEIKPKHRMPDMDNAGMWLYVNNQERQRGNTSQMIWSVPEIISELSESWQLKAGDLIYTGTPKGSGPIQRGEAFEGGINGAGAFKGRII